MKTYAHFDASTGVIRQVTSGPLFHIDGCAVAEFNNVEFTEAGRGGFRVDLTSAVLIEGADVVHVNLIPVEAQS